MSEAEVEDVMDGCKSLNAFAFGRRRHPSHLTTLWVARRDREILVKTHGKSGRR